MKKKKLSGAQQFHEYYSQIWGDRWDSLKAALVGDCIKVFRQNKWTPNINSNSEEFIPGCFLDEEIQEVAELNNLKSHYYMDPASVIVARNLKIQPGSKVLDMCAAPGGKSLILFEALNGEGTLVCNELSRTRKERLKKVLGEYIPQELHTSLNIRGFDGNRYGLNIKNDFDYVLLDAPCSGERHLIDSPTQMEKWSKKRTQRLSVAQYSLLCSALATAKPGAEIVYSTCSLSPLENERVIEKLLAKRSDEVEVVDELETYGHGEKREHGMIFLPDRCGFGPLYLCRLRKL